MTRIVMATPRVLILRAPGANCDAEAQFAFETAGAVADRVHINRLREQPALLQRFQILVVPGGFTYGDDVAAGKILANQLSCFLGDALRTFRDAEKLILGVCNGFQAILKAGLLAPPDEDGPLDAGPQRLRPFPGPLDHAPGLSRPLPFPDRYRPAARPDRPRGRSVPVPGGVDSARHGAGGAGRAEVRARRRDDGRPYNPTGSQGDVAGLCDATGRVLGLMPHPERHVLPTQHPRWTRLGLAPEGEGLALFRNGVRYFA